MFLGGCTMAEVAALRYRLLLQKFVVMMLICSNKQPVTDNLVKKTPFLVLKADYHLKVRYVACYDLWCCDTFLLSTSGQIFISRPDQYLLTNLFCCLIVPNFIFRYIRWFLELKLSETFFNLTNEWLWSLFRFLSQQEDSGVEYIVATTSIITGSTFIQSLATTLEAPLFWVKISGMHWQQIVDASWLLHFVLRRVCNDAIEEDGDGRWLQE